MFLELMKNQIALALIVFVIIAVCVIFRLDSASAKEIIIQIITAVGALVTGVGLERMRDSKERETDKPVEKEDINK